METYTLLLQYKIPLLNAIIAIMVAFATFIPLYRDILIAKSKRRGKPIWKQLTKSGWWFFIISIVVLFLGTWKIFYEWDQEISDNTEKTTLRLNIASLTKEIKQLKTEMDSNTDKIIGSQPKPMKPVKPNYKAVLTLVEAYGTLKSNPMLTFNSMRDKSEIVLLIKNIGNVEANIIEAQSRLVQYSNGKMVFDKKEILGNKSSIIYPIKQDVAHHQYKWNYVGINNKPIKFSIPSFIYFTIDYKYSGNKKDRLVKIFSLTDSSVYEAHYEKYNMVEKDLKLNHLWF